MGRGGGVIGEEGKAGRVVCLTPALDFCIHNQSPEHWHGFSWHNAGLLALCFSSFISFTLALSDPRWEKSGWDQREHVIVSILICLQNSLFGHQLVHHKQSKHVMACVKEGSAKIIFAWVEHWQSMNNCIQNTHYSL